MRILFSSVGGYGHLIPLLPLALAARDAGEDVLVATAEPFHALIAGAGLNPVSAGGNLRDAADELNRNPPADTHRRGALIFGDILARRAVPDLRRVIGDFRPDLVVYETLNPGAAIAAAIAGVRAVSHGLGLLSGGPAWSSMVEVWTSTARDFRVESAEQPFLGNTYIDICPPSLRPFEGPPATSIVALRPEAFKQIAPLPKVLLDRGRKQTQPLIYLTLGTAFSTAEALRTAVEGLSSLEADVLVTTGGRMPSDHWSVPANVFVETWLPDSEVMPHVDLVVSHGGAGTMIGTLRAGLPQLLLPQGAEQFENAHAIVEAGLGRRLLPQVRTSGAIAQAADELLSDDAVIERAREMKQEISLMPSCEQVVEQLRRP